MLTSQISTVVHPWYRQFYLRRGDAEWASDRVTAEGYAVRIEAIDGFVYVGTSMYGHPTAVRVGSTTPPRTPPTTPTTRRRCRWSGEGSWPS